jgi:hypothetical protein
MALRRKVSSILYSQNALATYSSLVEELDRNTDGACHDCGSGER